MNEKEEMRLNMMWDIERDAFSKGVKTIAGVDEAGRGPLAGDVFAAAVILPPFFSPEGLNDSKKVSEKKREILFDVICENAISYAIASASVEEIDEYNIRNATYMAMNRAITALKTTPEFVLVDGDDIKFCKLNHQCVVKGDSKSASIAAASILAKVSRDRYMAELDKIYPEYSFIKHKGYGTKVHIEALKIHGACEFHRKTFVKKFV